MRAMTPAPSDLTIRVAGAADVPALAELRALWIAASEPEPGFVERMASWIATEGERRTTWLAVAAGRPVGMASLLEYRRMPKPGREDSRWGYVSNMFVRDDRRNHGIGSALLAEVITVAEERSYARLVLSPSTEALSFYRRAGFLVPGQSSDGDLLLMRPGPG
jgi:GNAT superfamily N-acetyltransferase